MKSPFQTDEQCDPAAYDAWLQAQVQEALDDPRPGVPHAEVEAHFAALRKAALEGKRNPDGKR